METQLKGKDLNKLDLNFQEDLYIFSDKIKEQIKPFTDFELIDFKDIFANTNPVNVEIGIGNGEFLTHYASKFPEENFLGFEVVKRVIRKAISKAQKNELKNIKLIHYDGSFFVRLFPSESVKAFFINFPDPWPKKKHHKRRLLKTSFLKLLSEKMETGGTLYITTDHEHYAKEIMTNLILVDTLRSCFESVYIRELVDYYPTKYYRKFALNKGVYFFKLKKV